MKIPYRNSGFSDKVENEGQRLINKDGTYNVDKQGLTFFERFSLFHWLINLPLAKFILFLFVVYVAINASFAALYMLCGSNAIANTNGTNSFIDCFFFSSQTLTTVGYGALHPGNNAASFIAAIESFLGLLSFAMATGLLYSRFTRPKAKILFSKNALISPYKEINGLMIRLANAKESQLTRLEAGMSFSMLEDKDGEKFRRFYLLDLEIKQINVLATSWTLVHPIDENSPLYNLTKDKIDHSKAEIMVQLQGYDETYSQQVQTRTSFVATEIIWNAKFAKILGHSDDGKSTLNISGLSSYTLVD